MSKIISLFIVVVSLLVTVSAQSSKDQNRGFGGGSLASQRNEAAVIAEMKNFYSAQVSYHRTWAAMFGVLFQLREAGLIDDEMAAGEKYGYVFTFRRVPYSATSPDRFYLNARPRSYRQTGTRSFYMSNNCVVTGDDKRGRDAGPEDTVVDSCAPVIAHNWDSYALHGMRRIIAAQAIYTSTPGRGYASLNQLENANLLPRPFGPPNGRLWHREWTIETTGERGVPKFKARSTPYAYGENGIYSYFADETGVIRGADKQGAPADEFDPPIYSDPQDTSSINENTAYFLMWAMYGAQRSQPVVSPMGFATLEELDRYRTFSLPFEAGRFQGYVYSLVITPVIGTGMPHYEFTATPELYGVTGTMSFYMDETGFMRGGDKGGAEAHRGDPQVIYF